MSVLFTLTEAFQLCKDVTAIAELSAASPHHAVEYPATLLTPVLTAIIFWCLRVSHVHSITLTRFHDATAHE